MAAFLLSSASCASYLVSGGREQHLLVCARTLRDGQCEHGFSLSTVLRIVRKRTLFVRKKLRTCSFWYTGLWILKFMFYVSAGNPPA